jgi:hypothetical protein
METSEVLLTVAEVAIALAGFGGIAAGLGYRSRGSWNEQDRFRLLVMVSVSLTIVFACLAPFTLQNAGVDAPWRIAGGLLLLVPIGNLVIQYRLFRHGMPPGFSVWTTLSILASNLGGMTFIVLILFDLTGKYAEEGLYLAAVVLLLFSPAILFLRLIITSFVTTRDASE